MTELAIQVKGLQKSFAGKWAVRGVDIAMPKGQVWGFLGPNGSGKTTTIRMICGLLEPTAGEGRCLGFDILSQSAEIKEATGYMTQRFSFWEDLTIRENLEFVARLYHLPNRKKLVDEAIEKLGLAHRQHQLAGALSGGWKQRLALAAVTLHQPQLLLLDEPTAGVDPQARRDFWDEIHQLSYEGMTVLVSTHYMDEAERCDKIVYLANGRVLVQGTVAEVIDASNLVTYQAKGEDVRTLLQPIKAEREVHHAAFFGAALHVSGSDESELAKIAEKYTRPGITWQQVAPSLEDSFIELMAQAGLDDREYES